MQVSHVTFVLCLSLKMDFHFTVDMEEFEIKSGKARKGIEEKARKNEIRE